jgi:hypothetical protein
MEGGTALCVALEGCTVLMKLCIVSLYEPANMTVK